MAFRFRWKRYLALVLILAVAVLGFLLFVPPPSPSQIPPEQLGSLEVIQEGFDYPANVDSPDDGSNRIFVVEHHTGKIRVIQDGKTLPEDFLDIGDLLVEEENHETGLLDLEFPPNFKEKKYVYVTYDNRESRWVLSRFKVTDDTQKAIKDSEEILLATEPLERPYHHCGYMTFGPKGKYLYVCIGDADNKKASQDPSLILGSLLRLDVEGGKKPYGIPPGNPFVNSPGKRPEIWAMGLRNPWRFSFDSKTGDLFIPDVGDNSWEELNFQPASSPGGENYGWNLFEGYGCWKGKCQEVEKDIVWPIFEYPHGDMGCAIIGGAVYRGKKYPQWDGVYIFADHCGGNFWALRDIHTVPKIRYITDDEDTPIPNAIGVDYDGEILLVNWRGMIQRLNLPEQLGDDDDWEVLSHAVSSWQVKQLEELSEEKDFWTRIRASFQGYVKLFKPAKK